MKTIDEVIEKIEEFWVCPCVDEANEYCDLIEVREDVLHHLKEYRGLLKMWNDKLDKEQENQPLTWDELKQMGGKPVWIECEYYFRPQWVILTNVYDEKAMFIGDRIVDSELKEEMGDVWKAYRKERK